MDPCCSERSKSEAAAFGFVRAGSGSSLLAWDRPAHGHLERARAHARGGTHARRGAPVKTSQIKSSQVQNGEPAAIGGPFLYGAFGGPLQFQNPIRTKMREVISIHLGQCGVQIGNACWELYCLVRLRALEPNRTHRARPSCEPALACPIRARNPLPCSERVSRATPLPRAHAHRSGLFFMPCTPPHPNLPSQRASAPRPPLRLPITAPSVSRLVALCSLPAGARHPARRPDALGQDDRRRRRRLQHLLL